MAICSALPNTLTNGNTADATQVMANENQIVNNVNANAAHNGANSDITSLSGLTTPLSVAQGGTGANNLNALAKSGANSDITSLSGLTTPLSLSQGGTASTTASGARTSLGFDTSLTGALTKQPTRTVFTSGSGTYTTPTGCTRINVRMIGGGGGGAGSGGSFGAGGNGGDTTFGTLTAGKGTGAAASPGSNGGGGTASGGDINIAGGTGSSGGTNNSSALMGAMGGATVFGGAGPSCIEGAPGIAATANTGGGGGGGGKPASLQAGGGGGAGAYCEKLIVSPSSTYSYAVGAGGTAGTAGSSGYAGGAGAAGIIIIDEYYN